MTTTYQETETVPCSKRSCAEPEYKAKDDVPLCWDHFWGSYISEKAKTNKLITQLQDGGHLISHLPGTTYIIQLPNGNVKIGTTTKDVMTYLATGIKKQMKEHNLYAPGQHIKVLATLPGGETQERVLHLRFQHLRIVGPLEQFEPAEELLAFAHAQGYVDEMHLAFSDILLT